MGAANKGKADYLALGDWNAVCWRCGSKFKASEMQKTWQGFWTCLRCWEPRQPQDFATGVKEIVNPPWVQADQAPIFAAGALCTPTDRTALPGVGGPGCMIPGFIDPAYPPLYSPIGELPPLKQIIDPALNPATD